MSTSDGLTLRPWREGDAPAVVAAFAAPLMERQARGPIRTEEDALAWIAQWAPLAEADAAYAFAVTDGEGAAVGHVCVSAVDRRHDTGWVSYWTSSAARGRGVASRATRALADWALTELGLHRLELGHRTDNPASCGVALAAGFQIEGLERAKLKYDGRRFDVELHARLAAP
ncbi:GNAT family N-acetyltransferase [Streptacidiphilus monticola]|uniref:GNAT family N-acetyltransferase n=1 Tax=Streptacidiphilus monticola TaxID=2161674 RepID=A0ABW1FZB4_9ACTN